MTERHVVITGMGLVTPLGVGIEENRTHLRDLKTGIARHAAPAMPERFAYAGKITGDLKFEGDNDPKVKGQLKFLNRGSLLGFLAAREAISSSGINLDVLSPEKRSLYIASGDQTKVGYDFLYPAVRDSADPEWRNADRQKLNRSTLDKVNPFFLLESILNNLFSFLSAFFECMGPNTTLGSHSPCGVSALELGCRSIRNGTADMALVVGCGNWITGIPLYEMDGLGLISGCHDGAASFRPFDMRRDGYIPGEGGAAVLLEAADSAADRKAPVHARLEGFGSTVTPAFGGSGMVIPDLISARSIAAALGDAGAGLSDLSFIVAHGEGSPAGDRSELASIAAVNGGVMPPVPMCALKPYTGHLAAASDIADIILSVMAAREGMVPGTLNFAEPDGEFREANISALHRPCKGGPFLSVSYGLGGQSSAVVVRPMQDHD